MYPRLIAVCLLLLAPFGASAEPEPSAPIRLLFLGDNGHHQPARRFAELQPVLRARGIELSYTDRTSDLNQTKLQQYDGLMIYANIERISTEQEAALLDYVAAGHGFLPIHCASYCFLNSDKYVELVGAQFKRHGSGIFRTAIENTTHPVTQGYGGFQSWDETYVHHRHHQANRTVLAYRVDAQGSEPWTWVKTHGKGRVFYTAWGHDGRTWTNPGFHNLIERGVRWVVHQDPQVVPDFSDSDSFPIPSMTPLDSSKRPFEYTAAKVPFYPPSEKWGVQKEPIAQMQKPLEPSESIKHMSTPVGFRVELFAAEPDIGKPICMSWDHRGRLWIAETVDYPNDRQPSPMGRDRIRICEDTDGDGQADRFTIFAEQLSIPTSIAFAQGGVIIHQAPDTLYLKDTDGDDRADVREVLFTGWSTRDTHAGPSNLQYGLDNWLWGVQGYAGFSGTVGGETHEFRQGFYRFRLSAADSQVPVVSKLEFVRSTNNNTWGLGFSEEGLIFGSTANRVPSVYMPIANRYYESVRGWSVDPLVSIADTHLFRPITEKVRQVDHHGGYTAGAGHALYTARHYPREYWNRTAFVCGPTGHLIGTFLLRDTGSDFSSQNIFNLLASDDEWTAPIMAEVGPDGNVWFIDWYNFIVQHNPTPSGFERGQGNAYKTRLRDKRHGRIYRLVHETARPVKPFSLADTSPENLVQALKRPNMLWRRHAQRLLVERGEMDMVPRLIRLVTDRRIDAVGLNVGAIHALWTLHGLGALDGRHPGATEAAIGALAHRSAGVRRSAVAVLPRSSQGREAILQHNLLDDDNAQVRLAALLALSEMPASPAAAADIARSSLDPRYLQDRWLMDGTISAAARQQTHFLESLAKSESIQEQTLEIAQIVAEHVARSRPENQAANRLVAVLAAADETLASAILDGLGRGWPDHQIQLTASNEAALLAALDRLPPGAQGQVLKLAGAWGVSQLEQQAERIGNQLLQTVADQRAPITDRIAAAEQLIAFRSTDADVAEKLIDLVTIRTAPDVAHGILAALAESKAQELASALISRMSSLTPATRQQGLTLLLRRPEWTLSLLEAIENGTPANNSLLLLELSLDQQQALSNHPHQPIRRKARQLLSSQGALANADRTRVLDDLMRLTEQQGDATRGKQVYAKQCAKCHIHGGEGKRIGPDLTGMSVHSKAELLTHLIDPSRSVEGNYRSYTIVTEDGRVMTGLLAGESKTGIQLFDADGKQHDLLRDDIQQIVASPKSLMPDGFEKQVSESDLTDLLEFFTTRGRFVPVPLDKVSTIVSTKPMFTGRSAAEQLVFSDWSTKIFRGVPFELVDPLGDRVANVVMLHAPRGSQPPRMPKQVSLPCRGPVKTIHMLSGISGWGYPSHREPSVSLIVRLIYDDGQSEDHPLQNGLHFADYVRRVDVPESEFAFALRNQQLRYLAVHPRRLTPLKEIQLVKGNDATAPIVVAVTFETP